jgi:hypothetical protein
MHLYVEPFKAAIRIIKFKKIRGGALRRFSK